MDSDPTPADEQIRLAREYFARVDAGDPGLLAMFTDDAQAYFPKLGTARSKARSYGSYRRSPAPCRGSCTTRIG
jgi:hypothetical protein